MISRLSEKLRSLRTMGLSMAGAAALATVAFLPAQSAAEERDHRGIVDQHDRATGAETSSEQARNQVFLVIVRERDESRNVLDLLVGLLAVGEHEEERHRTCC